MNPCLGVIVSLIYAYVGGSLLVNGNIPMAVAYLGWAAANTAIIFAK